MESGQMRIRRSQLTGVSPAYFISRYTDRFTPADVCEGLAEIAELGFEKFQPEVFHAENLADWANGGSQQVRQRSDGLGLQPSQFIAHFMLNFFSNPSRVMSDSGLVEIDSVLEIVDRLEDCPVVTIPLGAFDPQGIVQRSDYIALFNRCVEKIGRLLERVEGAGRRLAPRGHHERPARRRKTGAWRIRGCGMGGGSHAGVHNSNIRIGRALLQPRRTCASS